MTDTTRLGLPLMDAAQAQKHVTHNDALVRIDALTHLSVATRANAPMTAPAEGARYLVLKTATGAFAGQGDNIAVVQDGAWIFVKPRAGWRLFVEDEFVLLAYDGSSWRMIASGASAPDQFAKLGVGTASDAGNPLSVKLNNALFASLNVAEGGTGDMRLKLNREAAARTVSQLYQSNWSGRAETGLMGDDFFRIKVSADGAAWNVALIVDPSTGNVGLGANAPVSKLDVAGNISVNGKQAVNGPAFSAVVSNAQMAAAGAFTKVMFRNKEFDTANCFDSTGTGRFKPTVAGFYQVNAALKQVSPSSGQWAAVLYKNGVAFKGGTDLAFPGAGNAQGVLSTLVYLNGSTDYLELYAYSDVGSMVAASVTGSFFQAVMARGA